MKYEYYITNYLCQNISLVKIMLTMNIGKKWLKSRQYLEKRSSRLYPNCTDLFTFLAFQLDNFKLQV